jgi:Spy/CpxP family protein refolding chaperone
MHLGYPPQLTLLEEVEGDGCVEETYWIKHHRGLGAKLVNGTDGGDGLAGYKLSDEQRQRMSEVRKGKSHSPHSLETRAKISASNMCHAVSSEARSKISLANKGRLGANLGKHLSDVTKAKLSASHKGISPSLEARAKISQAMKGRILTPEWKAKIGAASKGRIYSSDWRAKIGAARKGKKATPETLQRMSVARKGKPWSDARRHAYLRQQEIQHVAV